MIENDIKVLASGGTARMIREAGFEVADISMITKSPEMLGGRVKTLHPAVHGGILARNIASDEEDLAANAITKVDYVVCNLYPFRETISKANVTIEEAVEEIDIGGVTLLRAAAKNHARVTILSDPKDYPEFLEQLKEGGGISQQSRNLYSLKAFTMTAEYDDAISDFFRKKYASNIKQITLRYGANPHQAPAQAFVKDGVLPFQVINGSAGYINLLDALNSWQLVKELDASLGIPAAASFKHVSPAGAAVGMPLDDIEKKVFFVDDLPELSPIAAAYARARGADRMSSFGDFIAISQEVDQITAKIISREVSDGIIAAGYSPEALDILKKKKGGKYCILKMDPSYEPPVLESRQVYGIWLQQKHNDVVFTKNSFTEIVSKAKEIPQESLIDSFVASIALKYTQSNSVCYAKNGMVVGLGAGQQSRIHCTRLAGDKADLLWLRHNPKVLNLKFKQGVKRAEKSNAIDLYVLDKPFNSELERTQWESNFEVIPEPLTGEEREQWLSKNKGVTCASDAFFPFPDNVHRAAKSGTSVIVAPGGSQNDNIVHEAADDYGIVFCEVSHRLFHH